MHDPLVPPEVDLKGLGGFIMDINRLLASELMVVGTAEGKWAAFMLWCRSWQQSPPGSLPNDEKILAAFSGAGGRWKHVRETAMRGFIVCTDGRLYHPVVCEQVMRAWKGRKSYLNDQDRLRKWREKQRGNGDETRFNGGFRNGLETPCEMDVKPIRNPVEEKRREEKSTPANLQSPNPRAPAKTFGGLEEHVKIEQSSGKRVVGGWYLDASIRDILDAARIDETKWQGDIRPIIQWLADGLNPDDIVRVIARRADREGYQVPFSLKFFDKMVRQEPITRLPYSEPPHV